MKRIALMLTLAAPVAVTAVFAQTATPPAPKAATAKSTTASKPAVSAKTGTTAKAGVSSAYGPKLPPGVPPVHGLVKSAFALRYQEIKIGTGPLAEPNKLYKVHYTGWLASDGTKFDSSYDHRNPVIGKDGKPENDADGKPKLGDPQPLSFPQGFGRLIPGWDQGFDGMKVGGKRRLFIPYQLAYGATGRPPKIPAKSDLIFDVELVEVADLPQQQQRPGMPGMPGHPMPPRPGTAPGAPPVPPTGTAPVKPETPAAPAPGTPTTPVTPTPATPPAPAPAPTTPAPAPTTPAPTTPAPTTPDKPTNPAQPQ